LLLTIDVGNTNIVLGLYAGQGDNAKLVGDWRMRTDARMTADELALIMRGFLGAHADEVTGISALSTVPAVLRELRVLLSRYYPGLPKVVIEPGVKTGVPLLIESSVDALAARAAALRKVELVPPRSVIGKNTVECLQSGILYGFAGQVDGLVKRIVKELAPGHDEPVAVLATGGLAPLVLGESETITEHVPELTLLGLRLVYERNVR